MTVIQFSIKECSNFHAGKHQVLLNCRWFVVNKRQWENKETIPSKGWKLFTRTLLHHIKHLRDKFEYKGGRPLKQYVFWLLRKQGRAKGLASTYLIYFMLFAFWFELESGKRNSRNSRLRCVFLLFPSLGTWWHNGVFAEIT